ncbi:hypothetical protein BC827DRAFT_1384857 [Russula dissimulans]|nr:hypothetical protein BC827DRAFT_1384857 [Russula dissimulans]
MNARRVTKGTSLPAASADNALALKTTGTLKLPTQTQKPSRASRAVHKDLDSDIGLEYDDEDDHPHGADGRRPLTTRETVLASVVASSHVSLVETSRQKEQLNKFEITPRREEAARKRKHLSEKMKSLMSSRTRRR